MSRPQRRWMSRVQMADSMVLTAVFLAAAYWGLEAWINLFSPQEISFYRDIFGPHVGDMSMRIIVLCLFLIFGSHVQYTINQRRRAERDLRVSEEKYRSILESIEEGYYEVDLEGRFSFINDATSRILGLPRSELLQRNIREFLSQDGDGSLSKTFAECRSSGRAVKTFDCTFTRGETRLSIEASVSPLKDKAHEWVGFRGMLRDRSERKRLEMDLLESHRKLQHARAATILGLAKLAEYRDEGTGTHLERIREYAKRLAEEMAKAPRYREYIDQRYIEDIYQSAILHDIGKVGIPDAVLLKSGELTGGEFEIIKCHTQFGGDAISAIQTQIEGRTFLNIGREIAYNHHEKWDGTGYPRGLRGHDIPLAARIVAVADVYDALTTKRFYKEAFSHQKARQIILNLKGSHFDPEVVDAFLALDGEFDRVREERIRQEKKSDFSARECRPDSRQAAAVPVLSGSSARGYFSGSGESVKKSGFGVRGSATPSDLHCQSNLQPTPSAGKPG